MSLLYQGSRAALDEVMACWTRLLAAPGKDDLRRSFAEALSSRGHYRPAAAVLQGGGSALQWLSAELLLADGACGDAAAVLAAAEEREVLDVDALLLAAHIEIATGRPAAAIERLDLFSDGDPRFAALLDQARAWIATPDAMVDQLIALPRGGYDRIALATATGAALAWATDDPDRLQRLLGFLQGQELHRWSWSVLQHLGPRLRRAQNPDIDRSVALNEVSILLALMDYERAGNIAVDTVADRASPSDPTTRYRRFLAPLSDRLEGVRLKQLQQDALATIQAIAPATPMAHPRPAPLGGRRLRLGVLTPWYARPYFFNPPCYRDRTRLEVTAFVVNLDTAPEGMAADREAACYDRVVFLKRRSDREIAECIRHHEIDVLLDLTGQGAGERDTVLEWRPAPVQVVWTTKLSSTGSAVVDWFLADAALIPPEHDHHYTERVWRYDAVVTPWQSTFVQVPPAPPPRHSTGLITFGSPASVFKISDAAIALWCEILRQVPQSRFAYAATVSALDQIAHLYDRFARHGVPAERLVILYTIEPGDFLRLLNHVDIALDSVPFGCNRTASECLAQGVPLISTWGDRLVGRYTATQLQALGLHELIAADRMDYIARAVALAGDGARLDRWRRDLPELVRQSALIDPEHAMRTLEAALFGMWDDYVARAG